MPGIGPSRTQYWWCGTRSQHECVDVQGVWIGNVFSGPDGLGDLMGDDCDCQGVGGYTTVDDAVLVVWDEQEER